MLVPVMPTRAISFVRYSTYPPQTAASSTHTPRPSPLPTCPVLAPVPRPVRRPGAGGGRDCAKWVVSSRAGGER